MSMLNLNMFARGANQPSIDELPTLDEEMMDGDDESSTEGGESYDSDFDSTSGYESSTRTGGNEGSSTTEMSTTRRSEAFNAVGSKEARQICWLRGTVLLALLGATAILSVVIHLSTKRGEFEQFEGQFGEHATKIVDAFDANIRHGIGEIDNLAVSITSYSKSSAMKWPYAVIPEFGIRAESARNLANAAFISLVPLVTDDDRKGWESFAVRSSNWTKEGLEFVQDQATVTVEADDHRGRALHTSGLIQERPEVESMLQDFFQNIGGLEGTPVNVTNGLAEQLFTAEKTHKVVEEASGPYFPIWQSSPVLRDVVNLNLINHEDFGEVVQMALDSKQAVVGSFADISNLGDPFAALNHKVQGPVGTIILPVFDTFQEPRTLVGLLVSIIRWKDYLHAANLPSGANGIVCVLSDECGQEHSFEIINDQVVYLGERDMHEEGFDHFEMVKDFQSMVSSRDGRNATFSGTQVNMQYCPLSLHVYPSTSVRNQYITNRPVVYAVVVIVVFALLSITFVSYDLIVERRQKVLAKRAIKSHQIVSSLFPAVVRDRLFGDSEDEEQRKMEARPSPSKPLEQKLATEKLKLKSFLHTGQHKEEIGDKPIADLFTDCTVVFADIAGFTAWSSVREPAQVFSLLEAVYAAFDKIAVKRRVFKVETIGDCYVAVTGLPDPQPNHATIMVRFARECLDKMRHVTKKLEVELGPETSDLSFRFGMHSGPVTAGVLRGQKSRFQLFGDTVNTASRMESTGEADKIHCTQATANLLINTGKGSWLEPRGEIVEAKGKGVLKTYWVTPRTHTSSAGSRTSRSDCREETTTTSSVLPARMDSFDVDVATHKALVSLSPQRQRLVGWLVELLSQQLKNIVAHRNKVHIAENEQGSVVSKKCGVDENAILQREGSECPRDEYAESIPMPKFDLNIAGHYGEIDPEKIVLGQKVEEQLRDYVTIIACSYRNNPFHNFDHAGHVTMSTNKVLKRIVAADDCDRHHDTVQNFASQLHSHTYGITSDPLTHFTCVFAALIHDVDHPGVSNAQLVKEKDEMAAMYNGKSVAEQNSVDLAWELLMDGGYEELRNCIYTTEEEFRHFRRLLVNSVMATDIFDPDLMKLRNQRWAKAFSKTEGEDVSDLKATIVIEHIIQASDVAHTMQHWHVYQKWNAYFFEEQYCAWQSGRVPTDPSLGWYKGELWFYDNYIIPLANKLKECGVFGVASAEFLTYALDNRTEWEAKGEEIVADMKEKLLQKQEMEREKQRKKLEKSGSNVSNHEEQ